MSGSHGHAHSHGQDAARRLRTVVALSAAILLVEVIGAAVSGSLALLADAGHVLTDVAGLVLATVAASLAGRPATDRRTWGLRRAEVLSAAVQAAVLLVVGVAVLAFAVKHLIAPESVSAPSMLAFGGVALAVNAVSIVVLRPARGTDLTTRAAYLEVVVDAVGAVGVLVAGAVIAVTGAVRADAVASLLIALLILPRTVVLLRETVDILLETTPAGVDLQAIRSHLLGVDHVVAVHDLHASTIASRLPVLTAHVVVEDGCFLDGHCPRILDELQACLAGHFDVEHSTLQIEPATHESHEHAYH